MASKNGQEATWRKRVLGALALLLLISLAAHPELRLLVPFLDAVGLDLFVALLSTQALVFLGDTLKPYLLLLWQKLLPAIHKLERSLQCNSAFMAPLQFLSTTLASYSGVWGQFAWVHLSTLWRTAELGPNNSFKPNPLSGSAQFRR